MSFLAMILVFIGVLTYATSNTIAHRVSLYVPPSCGVVIGGALIEPDLRMNRPGSARRR